MTTDSTFSRLQQKLTPAGQQHLLQFWDELTAAEQARLAEQIDALDLNELGRLKGQFSAANADQTQAANAHRAHWAALAAKADSPPAMRLDGSGVPFTKQAAIERGEALLRGGQVGMILVAGGLGTRLGFDEPKGMFPIGPLSQRPLFQVLIENLLAARERYQAKIPLYVMTSPATDQKTREFLAAHDNFGLPAEDLHYFRQATMWVVDDSWQRILLASKSELALGPDGHGGMLRAFERSGALADCQRRGITQLFYGQIDNPLLQVCDPLLIGSHALAQAEMTTQVVRKRHPLERVGNLVAVDKQVLMIEYSDLPDEFAKQTLPDGSLKFWAGNLAVHVLDVAFLRRSAAADDALPFHIAHKKTPYVDPRGNRIEPAGPNAFRFERFIFDLLNSAKNSLVVEVDPAEAFAPVKNSDREATDNAPLARQAIIAQHRRWLREAGVAVADDVPVEINPRFAGTPAEVKSRFRAGTAITGPTYFAADGTPQVVSGSR